MVNCVLSGVGVILAAAAVTSSISPPRYPVHLAEILAKRFPEVSSRNSVNEINIPSFGYETETPPSSAKSPAFAGCDCGSIGKKRVPWTKIPGLSASTATPGWPGKTGSGNVDVVWVRAPLAAVSRLSTLKLKS